MISRRIRGLGIAGRMGSGKDYVFHVLHAAFPTMTLVSVGRLISKYIVDRELTHDGRIDRIRDLALMQRLGSTLRDHWSRTSKAAAQLLMEGGKIPVMCAVRTDADESAARSLGFPIIVVTAMREKRIARVMVRDQMTREQVLAHIDNPETEGYVDSIDADHTFSNDGVHTAGEFSRLFRFLEA